MTTQEQWITTPREFYEFLLEHVDEISVGMAIDNVDFTKPALVAQLRKGVEALIALPRDERIEVLNMLISRSRGPQ